MTLKFKAKYILLVSFAFIGVAFSHDVNAGTIIKAPAYLGLQGGLIGHWTFDMPDMGRSGANYTVKDRSGNNNNGVLDPVGLDVPDPVAGKVGQAIDIQDGGTQRVNFGDIEAMDTATALSACAWVKHRTISGNDGFIVKVDGGLNVGFYFFRSAAGTGGRTNTYIIRVYDSADTDSATLGGATNAAVKDIWTHTCFTFNAGDASGLRLYVNGVEDANSPVSTASIGAIDAGTNIFQLSNSYGEAFDGLMDEVRVYSRVLSSAEVARIHRIGLGSTANHSTVNTAMNKGLIGHWTFDGADIYGTSARDKSGEGHHGTITGATKAVGKLGQSLSFDGSQDSVATGWESPYDGGFTYSGWFYQNSRAGQQIHLGYATGNGFGDNEIEINNQDGAVPDAMFYSGVGTISLTDYTPQEWHLVTMTKSGTVFTAYVDGVYQGSITVTDGGVTAGGSLFIGSTTGLGRSFNGRIDDVRVYNRALSAEEVKRLYVQTQSSFNSKTTLMDKGLVGCWNFDGLYTKVPDCSGNNNTGTITGATKVTGKIGQAMSFDGTNDSVAVSSVNLSGTNIVSLAFWLYRDSYANDDDLAFESSTNFNVSTTGFLINPNSSDCTDNFVVAVRGDLGYNYGCYDRPEAGLWHHYVAILDKSKSSNEVDLYVDGVLQSALSRPENSDNTNNFGTDPLYFMSRAGSSLFGAGKLDDVRIYNRILSAEEVKRIYDSGR